MNNSPNLPISVAIITLNEEKRLADCLASVDFAAEIVVVDSFSSDKTVEIAKNYGAKIYSAEWLGFGRQKQMAIDHCTNQWVLVLDADERVPGQTAKEIGCCLADNNQYAAFSLPRKNFFMGRWIKHAGWWPDKVVRLINKDLCKMSQNLVHESIQVEGQIGALQSPLTHYATRNLAHTLAKIDRYSTAGAKEMFAEGKKSSYGKALARGGWAFFYNYFVRLGFLDLGPGFIIAVSDAANKFFKYAKLKEMQPRD